MSESRAVLDPKIQESLVLRGDLSGLNPEQKKQYYLYRCQQVGLDPAAKPFDLLTLNGKEVLYANANATQQLCSLHKLSTQITHREQLGDIYVVSVRVTGADGRVSENQGAVSIGGLAGEKLANAYLKGVTKAIRRSVLAHIGLGMLDESEVDSIPEAKRSVMDVEPPPPLTIEVPKPTSTGDWKVLMPGADEPYSSWQTAEAWVLGFQDLADRIINSQKIKPDQKMEKFKALIAVNETVSNSLDGQAFEQYDHLIRRYQGGLSKLINNQEKQDV